MYKYKIIDSWNVKFSGQFTNTQATFISGFFNLHNCIFKPFTSKANYISKWHNLLLLKCIIKSVQTFSELLIQSFVSSVSLVFNTSLITGRGKTENCRGVKALIFHNFTYFFRKYWGKYLLSSCNDTAMFYYHRENFSYFEMSSSFIKCIFQFSLH